MKKILTLALLLILIINSFALYAFAQSSVRVSIPVEIKGGGTAVIAPDGNLPEPEESSLELLDGETGEFVIDFFKADDYSYTVKLQPDDRKMKFDKNVYTVNISVFRTGGELKAYTVICDKNSGAKPDALRFKNTPYQTNKNKSGEKSAFKKPYTGDDMRLAEYLLAALVSAAGLFALSLVYYNSAKKQSKKKNQDN